MPVLLPDSGSGESNLVGGTGTTSAVFTMPVGVSLKVESVVASINNGGASAVTPKVTIRDQSGVVIATTTQDDAIPAGDTGTATFALRLVGKGGQLRYRKINSGPWLDVRTTDTGAKFNSSIYFEAFEDFRVHAGRDIDFDTFGGADFNVTTDNDLNLFPSNDGNFQALNNLNLSSDGTTSLQGVTALNLQGGDLSITNSKLGFFGVPAVAQQATPVTLANVIALLQAYGLAA